MEETPAAIEYFAADLDTMLARYDKECTNADLYWVLMITAKTIIHDAMGLNGLEIEIEEDYE